MTIPGTRYAYACDETNTTIFDSPFVNVDTWSTYQSPLILTASELLDNYAQWRVESKIPRTDLPEAFWTAFREGPDYVMSERPRCSTGIAVGVDHARKTFGPIMATAPELERAVRHIKKGYQPQIFFRTLTQISHGGIGVLRTSPENPETRDEGVVGDFSR